MNTTGKLVFALVIAAGIAATGAAVKLNAGSRTASTIQLDAVVVTPANAQKTIALAAVRVTPNQADRQYAKAHGVSLPVATVATAIMPKTIELAAIRVTPSTAEWQSAQLQDPSLPVASLVPAADSDSFGETGAQVLMQAVSALAPGQFLNSSAVLRALNVLAFGGNGR